MNLVEIDSIPMSDNLIALDEAYYLFNRVKKVQINTDLVTCQEKASFNTGEWLADIYTNTKTVRYGFFVIKDERC